MNRDFYKFSLKMGKILKKHQKGKQKDMSAAINENK